MKRVLVNSADVDRCPIHSMEADHYHDGICDCLIPNPSLLPEPTRKVPDGLSVKLQVVTPKMAEQWLEDNTHNRALRKGRAVAYARSMQRDEWEPAGDAAIIFDEEGVLMNGAHRLSAVILAGTPQVFMVLRGVKRKAQAVMDRALTRSMANALEMRGEMYASNLGIALRWLHRLAYIEANDGASPFYGHTENVPSIPALLNLLDENPDLRDSMKRCFPLLQQLKMRGHVPAVHYRCMELSSEDTDDFFGKLLTGSDMHANHPAMVLRQQLIKDRIRARERMPDFREAALLIRAWNFYRDGVDIQMLSFHYAGRQRDKFPIPH